MESDCISASGWEMERPASSRSEIEVTLADRLCKKWEGNPTNSKKMSRGEFEMTQNGGWIIAMTHQGN